MTMQVFRRTFEAQYPWSWSAEWITLKYDPALDGLRAVAVLAVVASHIGEVLSCPFAVGGWVGVDVFFVLSGFLITTILQAELRETGTISLRRFYLRRVLRLTPALWALLIATLAVAEVLHRLPEGAASVAFAATYLMSWASAFNWGPTFIIKHTWSLAVEEQFYLVWPAILLVMPTRWRVVGTSALLASAVGWRSALQYSGASVERTYFGFDTHSDGLLLGCLIALMELAPQGGRVPSIVSAGAITSFSMFVMLGGIRAPLTQSIGMTVTSLIATALLICARRDGWLRQALTWRPAVFVGRVSYGLYLWHYPALILAIDYLPRRAVPLVAAVSFAIAVASFYLIERPFLQRRLRDRPPNIRALE